MQQAGYLLEDIQKEIAKATGLMRTEIKEAMEDAGVQALSYDDAIYRAAGLDPLPLIQSPHLIRLMQDTYEQTLGEWTNFTSTTADAVQQTFIKLCDQAYTQVMSGSMGWTQATREAVERLISEGVRITYPSGHTDTIETATARVVRTGISQGSARITEARMDEMGVDLVIVSSHIGARPEHAEWQGKVYSRKGKTDKYEDFVTATGYGTVTGLCGANCRHSFSAFFEGMTNPYTQYDSEENRKQYEAEQKQRAMERRIRKTKREAMGYREAMENAQTEETKAAFEAKYQKKAALLQEQNKAYNQYCEETGLKKLPDRITIAKWDRSQAAKATAAARKYNSGVVRESSPRPGKSGDYSVDWDKIQSDSYNKKFENISSNGATNTAAAVRAKWALNNRDGTNTEELYALDMRNGAEIGRITEQNIPFGVTRTAQFDSRLQTAVSSGAKVMFIHNHPAGSPPSISDLNALVAMQGSCGITVGHDGSVYFYTSPKTMVETKEFELAFLKYKRYSYITAYEKALNEISTKYGFVVERK